MSTDIDNLKRSLSEARTNFYKKGSRLIPASDVGRKSLENLKKTLREIEEELEKIERKIETDDRRNKICETLTPRSPP